MGVLGVLAASMLVILVGRPRGLRADVGPSSLRLGLVSSLFRETPRSMVEVVTRPLRGLMEAQTGITGQLVSTADAASLARQLQDKQVDLGIFHGFEFAWARQKNPDLQPLLVVRTPQPLQAYLMVANDSPTHTCADLKGKMLALPLRSREHVHLFLERRCSCGFSHPKEFFAKVRRTADADDALDDLQRTPWGG